MRDMSQYPGYERALRRMKPAELLRELRRLESEVGTAQFALGAALNEPSTAARIVAVQTDLSRAQAKLDLAWAVASTYFPAVYG